MDAYKPEQFSTDLENLSQEALDVELNILSEEGALSLDSLLGPDDSSQPQSLEEEFAELNQLTAISDLETVDAPHADIQLDTDLDIDFDSEFAAFQTSQPIETADATNHTADGDLESIAAELEQLDPSVISDGEVTQALDQTDGTADFSELNVISDLPGMSNAGEIAALDDGADLSIEAAPGFDGSNELISNMNMDTADDMPVEMNSALDSVLDELGASDPEVLAALEAESDLELGIASLPVSEDSDIESLPVFEDLDEVEKLSELNAVPELEMASEMDAMSEIGDLADMPLDEEMTMDSSDAMKMAAPMLEMNLDSDGGLGELGDSEAELPVSVESEFGMDSDFEMDVNSLPIAGTSDEVEDLADLHASPELAMMSESEGAEDLDALRDMPLDSEFPMDASDNAVMEMTEPTGAMNPFSDEILDEVGETDVEAPYESELEAEGSGLPEMELEADTPLAVEEMGTPLPGDINESSLDLSAETENDAQGIHVLDDESQDQALENDEMPLNPERMIDPAEFDALQVQSYNQGALIAKLEAEIQMLKADPEQPQLDSEQMVEREAYESIQAEVQQLTEQVQDWEQRYDVLTRKFEEQSQWVQPEAHEALNQKVQAYSEQVQTLEAEKSDLEQSVLALQGQSDSRIDRVEYEAVLEQLQRLKERNARSLWTRFMDWVKGN